MKVVTLYTDCCGLCKEKMKASEPHLVAIEEAINSFRRYSSARYIRFHAECWDNACGLNNRANIIFTYEDWIDLTGDEFDPWGLVERHSWFEGGSKYLLNWEHQGFVITEERFKELSEMED